MQTASQKVGQIVMGLALVLACGSSGEAQTPTPIVPGQVIEYTVADTGRMQSGTTTVQRPEANVAFEYRINGGAPVTAVKHAPCVAGATPSAIVCRLVPPTLVAGTHEIQVRALASPAESGVQPSAYSQPLSVAVILVTSPGIPTGARIVTP
jgi:hypothetical protein